MSKKYKVLLHYRYTAELEVEAESEEEALVVAEQSTYLEQYNYYDGNEVEEL
jgi:hypothetical protein